MFWIYDINHLPVNISPIIRELLLHNEKSVIPGFGTFAIIHRPAELNRATGVLLAPSRDILFDNREKSDDGQLAGLLARKYQLGKTEVTESVASFVKSIEDQLAAKGTAYIEGMGNIRRDRSGKLIFNPLEELLGRVNLFELPKLDVPVKRSVSKPVPPGKPVQPTVKVHLKKKRKWWIPAALVTLLAGLSALVYFTGLYESFKSGNQTTVITSEDTGNADRLVFGNRVNTKTDTLQERISRELDKRTKREEALQYKEAKNKLAESNENLINEPVPATLTASEKPYHIIAGAFLVPNNAERQKSQLEKKGFSPILLPRQGDYYMVSLGSYDSREQAVAAMRQLRKELEKELWVMKM